MISEKDKKRDLVLRGQLIRLAREVPSLRASLVPLLHRRASLQDFLWAGRGLVEIGFNPQDGDLQVGMGGEWWFGEPFRKVPANYVYHHRKESVDPDYRPVMINIQKRGSDTLVFDISGGTGHEAVFTLELREGR